VTRRLPIIPWKTYIGSEGIGPVTWANPKSDCQFLPDSPRLAQQRRHRPAAPARQRSAARSSPGYWVKNRCRYRGGNIKQV